MPKTIDFWLSAFGCHSYQQLYLALRRVAKEKMRQDSLPFPMAALKYSAGCSVSAELDYFLTLCMKLQHGDNSDEHATQLIEYLKMNPPKESFCNPELPKGRLKKEELNLIHHIYFYGLELPGSRYNLLGHLQSFSSFFIDMFFGNFTEYQDHIKSLTNNDLKRALERREGYCQYSPIFAPILGLRVKYIDSDPHLTDKDKQEYRKMYSGHNENKHTEIFENLLELGADPNAFDLHGFTAFHYTLLDDEGGMTDALIKHGANPNSVSRNGWKPLDSLATPSYTETKMKLIDTLLQHNARTSEKKFSNMLRNNVEVHGSKELAVRVREAFPRANEECEKCLKICEKKCSACSQVYYCSPACQKLDWKFHKVMCHKKVKNISK